MPIYKDTEGTSNGLSRVSQLTASPALFGLLWLGCLPRIMAGERTKGLIVQGARVSTRPATPNEKAQLLRPMSPPWISRLYMHIFLQSPQGQSNEKSLGLAVIGYASQICHTGVR